MVKAVVSRGEIRPLAPLPADWPEGQPLLVEKADDGAMPVEDIDRDFALLANLCSDSDQVNEDQLDQGLHEADAETTRLYGGVYLELRRSGRALCCDRAQSLSTGREESPQQAPTLQLLQPGLPALGGTAQPLEDPRLLSRDHSRAIPEKPARVVALR